MGFSSSGNLETNIFPGAIYDSYAIKIYAQIYGSNGVYTIYDLADSVVITPDYSINLNLIQQRIISIDPTFSTNIILYQGNYLETFQALQIFSSLMNEQSLSDGLGLLKFNNNTDIRFPKIYGPLVKYKGVKPVKCLIYKL